MIDKVAINLGLTVLAGRWELGQVTGLMALISPELTNGTFGRLEKTKWKVNFYLAVSG